MITLIVLFTLLFPLSTLSQTCEPFVGTPSICSHYLTSVYVPLNSNQNELSLIATTQLSFSSILPNDTCRPLIEEMICKQVLRTCYISPFIQPLPKTPCKSMCLRVLDQCGQTMLMSGIPPPNCDAVDSSTLKPLYVDTFSNENGEIVPCDDSTLSNVMFPPPFSCATFNNTPPQCSSLVSTSIFQTNTFSLEQQANQLAFLAFLDQLPSACRDVFTELLCKTIMAECVQIDLSDLNVPFTFKSSPCRSSCEIVQNQCAQLFAFTNTRPPNCTDSSFGLENYPESSTTLPLANNQTIEIPCAPLISNVTTIPTFDCIIADNIPELCQPFIPNGSNVFQTTTFTLTDQIVAATSALSQFSTIPDSCRIALIEYTCKSIFQTCQEFSDVDVLGPTLFKFGRPPCKSSCLIVQEQCTEIFAFGNQLTPNCSAEHPGFAGQDLNPTDALVFNFFNTTFEVPCVKPIVVDLPPTFQCRKYMGEVQECNKYVPIDTIIWESSAFPYELMIQSANDAISQFTTIPDSCRLPLTEYTCLNIFQRCEKFTLEEIAEPIFLPHPPCQSVCLNVEDQCSQAFALGNSRPPNCTAIHPGFTGQLLTPVKGFEFNFFNNTLSLPCINSIESDLVKLFDCTHYDGQVKECDSYVPIGSKIWVSAQFTLEMMIGNATEAISQFAPIPDTCRIPLTEFTCKNIFAPCDKIPKDGTIGPVSFKFGQPVCKSMCENVGKQCAQIFAFGNQTAPDCNQPHPGFAGQELYPSDGFSFDFFNKTYTVECQKPEETHQSKSFSCEKFRGEPKVCASFIDYDVWVASAFTQDDQIKLATTSTQSLTAQIPSDCRQTALEFICKSIFQRCQKIDKDFLPVPFYYGQPPCPSLCNRFNNQCAQLFALGSGSATTTCSTSDKTIYSYGNKTFTVDCVDTVLPKPSPLFTCDRWLKEPSRCDSYIGENIYVFSPFPQDVMINLTITYLDILDQVSDTCLPFVRKLACKTIFQECIKLNDPVLPVEFIMGKPACKSICENVHTHCVKDLPSLGIPLPNCEEIDPLTKQERYPKDSLRLIMNNKTFSIDC